MINPARLDIYHNLLKSVAEEMGVSLMRTSFSPNIKERRDFSCAVFDGQGRMVVQGEHLPVHLGSMPLSVGSVLASIKLRDGDTAIVNDPYHGGTHLPDITLVTPVFQRGSTRPAFCVASRAHHADVGGSAPGSMPVSREIYQEGLIIPPILIVRRGEMQADVLSLLLANVRTPDERTGDILAQLAANQLGRRRLLEMLSSRGRNELLRAAAGLQEYAERIMRGFISSMPRGTYRFVDFMDDDGVSQDLRGRERFTRGRERLEAWRLKPRRLRRRRLNQGLLKIACEITIRSGEALVDFAGTAAQTAGCVNAPLAVTLSAVMYVFRTLLSGDVPSNYGSMLPIKVSAPGGSLLNARPPAAVAAGNVETSQRVVDVMYGALSRVPGLAVPAASSGTMNNVSMGGLNPRTGRRFTYYETIAGGMGARPEHDGLSAVHTHMTNTMNTPIEVIEKEYPLQVRRYSIGRGSGGQGKRSGGEGLTREIELLADSYVSILSDRRVISPYGLKGGKPGKPGVNTLLRGSRRSRLPSKVSICARAGDRIRIETPGGGGFGKQPRRAKGIGP